MLETLLAATIFVNGVMVQEEKPPYAPENPLEVFEQVTGENVPVLKYKKDDNVTIDVKDGILQIETDEPKVIYREKEVIKYVEKPVYKYKQEEPQSETQEAPSEDATVSVTDEVMPEPEKPVEDASEWQDGFTFTYYTAACEGCSGITSTGVDVRGAATYQGMRVLAVNPDVIPYWSIVEVQLANGHTFTGIALDTGGKMRQQPSFIDVLVGTDSEAYANGVDEGKFKFIRKGRGN